MTRHELMQRRLEAERRARARILPDVSTRAVSAPSRFATPLRGVIDGYRQTPESWASVWDDEPPTPPRRR